MAAPIPPAPGHADLPVLFWAHYMPMCGTLQIDANEHAHGGTDCFPFLPVLRGVAEYEAHIRLALEAGIDGFQLLRDAPDEAYEAARRVRAAGGGMFYLNPQWCAQGADPAPAFARMADFALAHRDDPHVFRIGGKQVHFFYAVAWAGGDDDERIEQARAFIRARGVEVLLMPANGSHRLRPSDTLLLDRPDLDHRPWPPFARPEPGPLHHLATTRWDGCDAWGPRDMPDHLMAALVERLRPFAGRYLFIPAVAPGYDSANRAWQAIHCPHRGIGVLRDGLRQALRFGFRQIDCVTWNDVNETMLLPSTRSPWGFSTVLRFWRGVAEDGRSPFATPQVVVAYDAEALYGDELAFQVVVMPERGALSGDYLVRVRLLDQHGGEAATLSTRLAVPDDTADAVTELRLDTTPLLGRAEVLSPLVEVLRVDPVSGVSRILHQRLRLAPITLRANQLRFLTAYAIALDRVEPELELGLAADAVDAPAGALLPLRFNHRGPTPLRRLMLAEGRLARGAVRADDTPAAIGPGRVRVFLRLRSERCLAVAVTLDDGVIHERHANHWRVEAVVEPHQAVEAAGWQGLTYPHLAPGEAPPNGMQDGLGQAVLRCTAAAGSAVQVAVAGRTVLRASLSALAAAPVQVVVGAGAGRQVLRLELTLDAVEANQEHALPAVGEGLRFLPISRFEDETRYVHAWALSERGTLAYSPPLAVVRRAADGAEAVPLPLIRTRGTAEDFISSASSGPRNPFTAADVLAAAVPARLLPRWRIACDEGAGPLLNHGGSAHQRGRAWLEGAIAWADDGAGGPCLRCAGGRIAVRSASMPHGAYTCCLRVRVDALPPGPVLLAWDGDDWQGVVTDALRIELRPDGRIAARRQAGASQGEALADRPLHPGWNHVVVSYDLARLRIFLDGAPAGEGPVPVPGYQRSHSRPGFGFRPLAADAPPCIGFLAGIEMVGTALDPAAIARLARGGAARP
ncbi:MAG: hypothetical protein L6R48_03585 [Planctomycetes bacterium]|nr:hypothetical protein [Planctomycetota bacterium]